MGHSNMRDGNKLIAVLCGLLMTISAAAEPLSQVIEQSVRPLPKDLQAKAHVYKYDTKTGERVVLREGHNHVECKVKDEQGHTRCYARSSAKYRDVEHRHKRAGLTGDDLRSKMEAEIAAGTVEPVKFGSVMYRLYEREDNIRWLWVVWMPYAKRSDLGFSTVVGWNPSRAGQGIPWMMNEGKIDAHIMIPVNATERSNKIENPYSES